jgi:uncharacterized protein (TIGR04255 family)
MLKALPEPDRSLLPGAPVNLVVASFGYATESQWQPQLGLRLKEALQSRGMDAKLNPIVQPQVTVSVAGSAESRTRRGFHIQCTNGTAVKLFEDSLVIESREYNGWKDFRGLVDDLLVYVHEGREIAVVNAISLRYFNALSRPDAKSAAYWQGRVAPEFLAATTDNAILPDFRSSLYLLSLTDGTISGEIRIGVQPDAVYDGCIAFVFEMDFTNTEPREFNEGALSTSLDELNTASLKMFHRIVSEQGLKELANV